MKYANKSEQAHTTRTIPTIAPASDDDDVKLWSSSTSALLGNDEIEVEMVEIVVGVGV